MAERTSGCTKKLFFGKKDQRLQKEVIHKTEKTIGRKKKFTYALVLCSYLIGSQDFTGQSKKLLTL